MQSLIPSVSVGTLVFAVDMPDPWPPPRQGIILETLLEDGRLVVGVTSRATVVVILEPADSTSNVQAESRPIRLVRRFPVIFTIAWENRAFVQLRLNAFDALNGEQEITLDSVPSSYPGIDFSERSERARDSRYHSLRGIHADPRRRDGGYDYMMAALEDEADQIADLLQLIAEGREAHVPGLAARSRLLTVGKPFGLLQHCAAYDRLPLILFADRFPEMEPPVPGAIAVFGGASASASEYYSNPVDLDVWLKFPAVKIGERSFSHRDIIKELGDTIGAHRDHEIGMLVDALRFHRTNQSSRYRDLRRYVVNAGEALLGLSRQVLSQRRTSPTPQFPAG